MKFYVSSTGLAELSKKSYRTAARLFLETSFDHVDFAEVPSPFTSFYSFLFAMLYYFLALNEIYLDGVILSSHQSLDQLIDQMINCDFDYWRLSNHLNHLFILLCYDCLIIETSQSISL